MTDNSQYNQRRYQPVRASDTQKKYIKNKERQSTVEFLRNFALILYNLLRALSKSIYVKAQRIKQYIRNRTNTHRLHNPMKKKNAEKRTEAWKFLKKFILWSTLIGTLAVIIGGGILIVWAGKNLPDPNRLTDREIAQSTKLYDRTGEHMLYEIFVDQRRTIVTIDEIPDDLIEGLIATEDSQFYEHKGVRPLSILRSFIYGAIGKGRIGGGASTLTQQLVKNAIVGDARSGMAGISRKLKEIILAVRLEQKYSKDQILQIYFNEIPYGSTNFGIQAAAQSYFGKNVQELNLQECATLAGLPKQPSRYLNDHELLKNRRNFVLERMFEEGYITREQADEAQATDMTLSLNYGDIKAPHFSLYVKELLVDQFGEQKVHTGGLKVITSLDWDLQQDAQEVVATTGAELLKAAGANNTSLVAMDPTNGQILSMIGSADFYNNEINGQFNVATRGKRQPGSSFKPIIYTAAFEKGYTPDTILFDVVTNFSLSGTPYIPKNYDLREHGPVTIRKALQGSLNIPAVKALYLVGPKKGIEFAQRLGYTTFEDGNFGLSLVLGGGEVKLLEHVGAYSVFANNGRKQPITPILSVEDPDGNILFETKTEAGEKVLDEQYAHMISNVLSDDAARAYAFGAGSILTIPGHQVAVKTGTTNNYKDAWTIGYTPRIVVGVWAGNTNNTSMNPSFGGSKVAAPIWNAFMRKTLDGTDNIAFPAPPANTAQKPVLRGQNEGQVTLKIDEVTGLLASSSTPEDYIVERTYMLPHSILHYVEKDNPQGPIPEHPENDPQYAVWEAAIQGWITKKKEEDPNWDVLFEDPPTEYDDEQVLQMMPTLEIVFPQEGQNVTDQTINTDIRVSAQRGIKQVSYKIDGTYVGVITEHPFSLSYDGKNLETGAHTLTVIAEDDIGNRAQKEIPFFYSAAQVPAHAVFANPPSSISLEDFPHLLYVRPTRAENIDRIEVYASKGNEVQTVTVIAQVIPDVNGLISVQWDGPSKTGTWELSIETQRKDGSGSVTDTKNVTVTQ